MKRLYYFGEIKDYSDRWLLRFLKKHYYVTRIDPVQKVFPHQSCDIIINRLYGSVISRYGEKRILRLLKEIGRLKKRRTHLVNSVTGYKFDINRVGQYAFFSKNQLPFVKTVLASRVLSKDDNIQFPCVVKTDTRSRNKVLLIIKNINDLYSFPAATRSDLVLQSLIRGRTCYRTEFVGNDSFTFTQLIEFQDDCLSFKYTKMVVSTPLSSQIKGKLIRLMATMGVQAFSVEYFLKVGQPSIVDCNMTSNYQYFFINRVREQLGRAWLNLINHEVI